MKPSCGVGMLEGVSSSESFVPHLWIMGRTDPAVPVCMSVWTHPYFTTDIPVFGYLATED